MCTAKVWTDPLRPRRSARDQRSTPGPTFNAQSWLQHTQACVGLVWALAVQSHSRTSGGDAQRLDWKLKLKLKLKTSDRFPPCFLLHYGDVQPKKSN
jgi:hypothetical protein